MPPHARPLPERFWEKVNIIWDVNSCWEWMAFRSDQGYGKYRTYKKEKTEVATRVAYRLVYGDFDRSLYVLHTCDNPSCVRPQHLFLGTQLDNMKDKLAKG